MFYHFCFGRLGGDKKERVFREIHEKFVTTFLDQSYHDPDSGEYEGENISSSLPFIGLILRGRKGHQLPLQHSIIFPK